MERSNDGNGMSNAVFDCRESFVNGLPYGGLEQEPAEEQCVVEGEVVLVALWKDGKLGAAYYDSMTKEISVLQDAIDLSPDFVLTHFLVSQIQPKYLLSIGSQKEKFTQTLLSMSGEMQNSKSLFNFRLLPAKEYSFVAAKAAVGTLRLASSPPNSSEEENLLYLQSIINLNQIVCVHALGTLIMFLTKNMSQLKLNCNELADDADENDEKFRTLNLIPLMGKNATEAHIDISKVYGSDSITVRTCQNWFSKFHSGDFLLIDKQRSGRKIEVDDDKIMVLIKSENLVYISEDTYNGLQIFKSSNHPSGFKRGIFHNNKIEGLSLFKLFDRCKSSMGSCYLRQMMYFPTNDMHILTKRHQFIEFCLNPLHDHLFKSLVSCISHIPYVYSFVLKLKNMISTMFEWRKLRTTITNILMIFEMCEHFMNEVEIFAEYSNSIDMNLYLMLAAIDKTIQFDKNDSFIVKTGVDVILDAKKKFYDDLRYKITNAANCDMRKLPDFIRTCRIVYFPEIGYLVTIKEWSEHCTGQEIEQYGFQLKCKIYDWFYYKSATCLDLDNRLGDVQEDIQQHEHRILYRLSKYIESLCHLLFPPIKIIYEMDCLICFAETARNMNYVKPKLSDGNDFIIECGRHPLAEMCIDNFVPNEYRSLTDRNRLKILTGPNSCGKSVYLKQIALIAYMAHLGSFVPARNAIVPLLNSIHTRVNSTESTANQISSFMKDLRQTSQSVLYSVRSSLVLIDEFGKGTDDIDGKVLLASLINHFIERKENAPHVIIATHFLDIAKFTIDCEWLCFFTFEKILNDENQPIFLYKLIEGMVDSSLALHVTLAGSSDSKLVDRARSLMKDSLENHEFQVNTDLVSNLVRMNQYVKIFQTILSLENPTIEEVKSIFQSNKNLL